MQNTLRFAALAALALAAFGAAPVPRKAPEFVIQSTNGKQTLLSSYRGKAVVLALMFTTCPHCQKAAQTLSQLQKEYADKGLQVLGATWDKDAAKNVDQFNRVLGVNFPCGYSNNEAVMTFLQQPASNPPFVPIMVFIDRTGTIRELRMVTGDDGADSPVQRWFSELDTNLRIDIEKLLKTGPATSRK